MVDFLGLFNSIAKVAKPASIGFTQITDKQVNLKESGLDSLDVLMICVFLCEIYGISEEVGKSLNPTTVQEAEDFVMHHKTQEPESIELAVETIS